MERLEEAMNAYWGERCADYDATCPTCKAWREFDEALGRWQPIESAPRDGTPVIIYYPIWGGTVPERDVHFVAEWDGGREDMEEIEGSWWSFGHGHIGDNPTHWMPLPPPPPT